MKLANDTITVINKRYNPVTSFDVYTATVLTGVSWYSTVAVAVEQTGLNAADSFIVRIPTELCGNYVDPVAYKSGADGWTLTSGDIIVKDAVTGDIKPADLQKANYEYMTVKGVTDNRRAPNAPHFKVVGV